MRSEKLIQQFEQLSQLETTVAVGLILHGDGVLNFFPESFLPSEDEATYDLLPKELQELQKSYNRQELDLLKESHLPKASDAELFMETACHDSTDGQLLSETEVIKRFADGTHTLIAFVQHNFQSSEIIQNAMNKTYALFETVIAKIAPLLDQDLSDPRVYQELSVHDLHYSNLRDLARTFYMEGEMAAGSINPTRPEDVVGWQPEDNNIKKRHRLNAQVASEEIYGSLDKALWQQTVCKMCESFRKPGVNDDEVDRYASMLIGSISEVDRQQALTEIGLLKKDKAREREETLIKQGVQFCQASIVMNLGHNIESREQLSKWSRSIKETFEKAGIKSGELQSALNQYFQEHLATVTNELELEQLFNPVIEATVLKGKSSAFKQALEQLGMPENARLQDVVDLLNLTPTALEKLQDVTNWTEEIGKVAFGKYQRRNSGEITLALKRYYESMGIPVAISTDKQIIVPATIPGENLVVLKLVKGNMLSLSTTDSTLKFPVAREFTVHNGVRVEHHELKGHLGGPKRVAECAADLENTARSNAANEALALVLQEIGSVVMDDPSLSIITLTDEGPKGIDGLYRRALARKYQVTEDEVTVPISEGLEYILAIGLHLGYSDDFRGHDLKYVFDSMTQFFRLKYRFMGLAEAEVERKSQEDAYKVGIMRQARGFWTGEEITLKNISYASGNAMLQQMMNRRKSFTQLLFGKVGMEHQKYVKAFGLTSAALDQRWTTVDRQKLLEAFGLVD